MKFQLAYTDSIPHEHAIRRSRTPSKAQLQVFNNLDLMEIIFQNFFHPPDSQHKHNLKQAALTSKCFFDPAMNLLWRTLDAFFPVLCALPGLLSFPTDDSSIYYRELYYARQILFYGSNVFSNTSISRRHGMILAKSTSVQSTDIASASGISELDILQITTR